MENPQKPPLGIFPRKFWIEDRVRLIDEAILRYFEANWPVPVEWLEERNDHINYLRGN